KCTGAVNRPGSSAEFKMQDGQRGRHSVEFRDPTFPRTYSAAGGHPWIPPVFVRARAGGRLNTPAILALEDGTLFHGRSIGAAGIAVGEVCFNTAMIGYSAVLTDPAYRGLLVTLTYPH